MKCNDYISSPSYFWSCLTLNDNCPYFSSSDPTILYFAAVLLCLYTAFLLMIFADLKFYWTLSQFQQQIHFYINFVKDKVRLVQMNQRRLLSTKERTEKQLKRSEECKRVVTALRGALADNNDKLKMLTHADKEINELPQRGDWAQCETSVTFSE